MKNRFKLVPLLVLMFSINAFTDVQEDIWKYLNDGYIPYALELIETHGVKMSFRPYPGALSNGDLLRKFDLIRHNTPISEIEQREFAEKLGGTIVEPFVIALDN